jgi:CRP-like cAMP-binding protein
VAILSDGDVFGEMSALGGEPRSATVRTIGPTTAFSIGRDDVRRLMEIRPDIRGALVDTAAKRRAALAEAVSFTRVAREAHSREVADPGR